MADAPGMKDALAKLMGDIRMQRDAVDRAQATLNAEKATLARLIAVANDYQSYIDFKATQP